MYFRGHFPKPFSDHFLVIFGQRWRPDSSPDLPHPGARFAHFLMIFGHHLRPDSSPDLPHPGACFGHLIVIFGHRRRPDSVCEPPDSGGFFGHFFGLFSHTAGSQFLYRNHITRKNDNGAIKPKIHHPTVRSAWHGTQKCVSDPRNQSIYLRMYLRYSWQGTSEPISWQNENCAIKPISRPPEIEILPLNPIRFRDQKKRQTAKK